jgi:glutathione peroxidase
MQQSEYALSTNKEEVMRKHVTIILVILCSALLICLSCSGSKQPEVIQADRTAYDFMLTDIKGSQIDLSTYKGKNVTLFVNTATGCGLTPQFLKLQALYDKYKDRGFVVIGFPSDTFKQEPRTEQDIVTFCTDTYLVTFPMTVITDMKGPDKNPLFAWLSDPANNPAWPTAQGEVSWNFEKFIVNRDGKIVGRFKPEVEPDDPLIVATVEAALMK